MKKIEESVQPNLGNNLRALRTLRNYTQAYMASQLQISKSRYSQMEQNENISTLYLYKIIEILEIDVQTFLHHDLVKIFEDSLRYMPSK